MLKIGGIYTEIEDEYIYVILEYNSSQQRYFICQLKDMNYNENKMIVKNLSLKNWRKIYESEKRFSYVHVDKQIIHEDINGYLGQINESLLEELKSELHNQDWYIFFKN